MTSDSSPPLRGLDRAYLARGVRGSVCFPALILCLAFVGFGAFARDAGLSVWMIVLMSLTTWALPSMVVFVATVSTGAGLLAAAIAVALSAVRLLPMTVAIVPQMRSEPVPRAWLYLASTFIAVTAYLEAVLRFPTLPPDKRLSYFLGFGLGLITWATSAGVLGYHLAASLPLPVTAGLVLLSPLYFLISTLAAARAPADRSAVAFGLVLGPVFHLIEPTFDLLWAGLIGGTLGYLVERVRRERRPA